jgi:hypothetical protein
MPPTRKKTTKPPKAISRAAPRTYVGTGISRTLPRQQVTPELIAELAARLTARDRWLLELLHEHKVFTTSQITKLAFGSISAATHRMLALWQLRAVERFRPFIVAGSAPLHYVLGPAGAAVLAATRGQSAAEYGYRADQALAISHSRTLPHQLGVNDIFAALVAHARSHPHAALEAWWPEQRCTRAWGKIVRPDAYGRWHENGQRVDFFVEYDTGSEPLHRLTRKIGDYGQLAEMTGITTTPVLFFLPSLDRERHLHGLALTSSPPIATTNTETLTAAGGPAGPAWRLIGTSSPTASPTDTAGGREHLADLAGLADHPDGTAPR